MGCSKRNSIALWSPWAEGEVVQMKPKSERWSTAWYVCGEYERAEESDRQLLEDMAFKWSTAGLLLVSEGARGHLNGTGASALLLGHGCKVGMAHRMCPVASASCSVRRSLRDVPPLAGDVGVMAYV